MARRLVAGRAYPDTCRQTNVLLELRSILGTAASLAAFSAEWTAAVAGADWGWPSVVPLELPTPERGARGARNSNSGSLRHPRASDIFPIDAIGKRSLGFARPRPPVSPPSRLRSRVAIRGQNLHLFPRETRLVDGGIWRRLHSGTRLWLQPRSVRQFSGIANSGVQIRGHAARIPTLVLLWI